MDAAELMEWVAHTQLQDEDYCARMEKDMSSERTDSEKDKAVRALLMGIV